MSRDVTEELKQRLTRAVLAMQKMQARIDTLEGARSEPIAIVGMGCRFPGGADTPEAYWELLSQGRDAVRREPASRRAGPDTGAVRWGGYLEDVSGFDAAFFGISPREADSMDPRQRLLLEVAWEALEHAGQDPLRLVDTSTGVFVGVTGDDYWRLLANDSARLDPYCATGNGHCFPPGRISYALGLRGPSLAVDTACSSSLVAVHLACQSLRSGECDVALAGGANLVLDPAVTETLERMGALSPNGRCSVFDARANGFVRGEGCGLIVLKRLSDARAHGDDILAVIRGSAVNQDGRSQGLTAPNGLAQQALLRQALASAKVAPGALGYVEAHGTGTSLGDPIEFEALAGVLGQPRADGSRCALGSVKTNLGHLEAAAGIAGLMKAVLALRHEAIPRHLNYSRLNPRIRMEGTAFFIPTEAHPWPRAAAPRFAGVSAMGMSGTNAHVILEEGPVAPVAAKPAVRPVHVLTLSARSEEALVAMARGHAAHLTSHPELDVADVCFTANTSRARLPHRLAVTGGSVQALASGLSAFASGTKSEAVARGTAGHDAPKVAFLFTGQGSQFVGMGRRLYETSPVFRDALERCAARLKPHLDLLAVLYPAGGERSPIDQTAYSQPALFALEYALAEVWRAWGVVPDAVIGHSVGELTAACVAGYLSLEDALELVAERGRLMQALPPGGAMATVFAPESQVAPLLAPYGEQVSIAAYNSPGQLTLSGAAEPLGLVTAELEARSVLVRRLNVSHAFHSPLMEPMLGALDAKAAKVTWTPGRVPLVSNVTGQPVDVKALSAPGYWRRHARGAVHFQQGMESLRGLGVDFFLEVGSHATLLELGKACLGEGAGWRSSLRKGRDDVEYLHGGLGHLFARGYELDWRKVDPEPARRKVVLPRYPWQRQRHWALGDGALSPSAAAPAREAGAKGELYAVEWEPRARAASARAVPEGTWLLLCDAGGVGARLAEGMEARGMRCVKVPAGTGALEGMWPQVTPCAGVVYLRGLDVTGVEGTGPRDACLDVASLLRAPESMGRLWLVTRSAQAVGASDVAPAQAPLWGLGRVVALEAPERWGGLIDLGPEDGAEALVEELCSGDGEDQVALRGRERYVARLVERQAPETRAVPVHPEATYLVTGGQGALGLDVARWLVRQGARHLVLTARSEFPARERWDALEAQGGELAARVATVRELERLGATVVLARAVVSLQEDMAALLTRIRSELPPLRGIVHAAAVGSSARVRDLDARTLDAMLAPKVAGAWNLHVLTREDPLDFFVLFSSIAGVWGSEGLGHYAAANAFLDALAAHRHARGQVATSVGWGPWMGAGLATEEQRRWLESVGVDALEREAALGWLERLLGARVPQAVVASVRWERFRPILEARRPRPLLARLGAKEGRPSPAAAWSGDGEALRALVERTVVHTLGLERGQALEPERGFSELGMSSIMAVDLKGQLEGALGLKLPATLAFNFPNVAALTEHLATRLAARVAPLAVPEAPRQARVDDPIAIVGMACRLPGGVETPEAFWELLREGRDAISEVPPDRWDVGDWYDADPSTPGKMHVRAGGFLREVDRFEPGFFGISPREAESLDPQQRLMLEVAWEALERAGQNPSALRDSRTGVFVGISSSDYGRVMLQGAAEDVGAWFASGSSLSMAAGRLSYTLGLRGPSLSVDTACSSSLVALHLACQSLRAGESELALAAGVNLILSPEPVVAASKARMLSPDGRCKTFDASANGFARAEGCGVLVLKRLSEAQARGDTVLAVIRGTAVNHDGPSSGLTVPNGPAQQAVIQQALRDAAVSPREVSYLEAHGTGTSLGDPIEAEAMWAVLKEGRQDESLWMGSVKTNLGHLESAAGVAGVMKVVLAMQRKQLPAHLHLKEPSPHIDWKGMGVKVPTRLTDWAPSQDRRIAGVSSFGFSGTNAHVVLEEAPAVPERTEEAGSAQVLVLSARSEEALGQQVTRYRQWLETSSESLEDVCFTAAVGRAHFEHRAAVVARSREELKRKLEAGEVLRGRVGSPEPRGEGLAERYVRGEPVDFSAWTGRRRVVLPTYPFQRQRYWWRGKAGRVVRGEAGGKPHLGRRLRSPALEALVYETTYSAAGPSHLDDHRLFGTMVAAGSSHVSLALAAVEDAHGSVTCTVEDMVFRQALVLAEDESRTVQFIAEGSAFEVKSLDGGTGAWVTHSAGRVRVGQVEAPGPMPSLEALQARFRERRPGDDLYRRMHEGGYILGTSYRWVHEVARDGDELLGELRPPENQEGLEDYPLHPGFVDSCFQVLGGWSLDPTVWADGDLIVPFSIARLTVHRRPRGTVWCHARIEGGKDVRAEESLGGDLRLFDAQGLVAEIQGFRGRLASRDSVLRGMQPRQLASRYERSWRPGPAAPPVRPVVDARPWVLLEDAQGVGERLGRMLEAAGASVRRVRPGSGFRNLGGGAFEVDARDFAQGWAEAAGPAGCAGVVYLWGLDGAPAQGASAEAVQRAALEASGGALNLVKALVGQGGAPAPLWLVTRGAWAIEPSASPLALSQSVLWGLGRVLDLEHPGLRCTRVDLDPGELERSVQLLGAELSRGEDSPVREVAFRAGTCLYPVLREAVGPRGDAVAIRSDATYLITGGLGGLGLETARWLVERGARALVLVGRRAPSASASEAVRALEGAGVRVSVASVDVSREEAVSALLRRMDAELPPLRGIIHAAGVLDDGALLKQDLERFERVMAPKVAGAWNLHRLTEGRPLDFFVLFSSASATLGSPGQGNYAAANAFLDALAEERRARGLVAQSLAWGPWAETGMVGAADGPLARELERRGVRPLPTREALALLGDALTRDRAGGMLLSIQWPLYLRGVGALARSPLYEGVAPAAPREAVAPVRSRALLAEQLLAAVPHERPEVLARSLQEEVARVLQLPPAELGRQQEFADVGMDSLMAIELRDALQKELGRSIPVTAALEHRTVEALARYLLEEVVKDTPPEAPRAAPRLEPEAALEEELSMLSDAELARLVAEDLAKES